MFVLTAAVESVLVCNTDEESELIIAVFEEKVSALKPAVTATVSNLAIEEEMLSVANESVLREFVSTTGAVSFSAAVKFNAMIDEADNCGTSNEDSTVSDRALISLIAVMFPTRIISTQ